ncbi:globin domain-containing protein [Streptodolium elevatio]
MAKYFYARLFREHPGVRSLFPDDMADQRDRLFGALTAAVAHVDDADVLVPFLRGLGADHRRFGAVAAHYPAVGQGLVATIRFFSGDAWSAEVEAAWKAAYDVIAGVMVEAARQAEAAGEPAVWDAKVPRRERPAPTVATFTLQVEPDYPFRAGQYLSLTLHEAEVRNVWRDRLGSGQGARRGLRAALPRPARHTTARGARQRRRLRRGGRRAVAAPLPAP